MFTSCPGAFCAQANFLYINNYPGICSLTSSAPFMPMFICLFIYKLLILDGSSGHLLSLDPVSTFLIGLIHLLHEARSFKAYVMI